MTPMMAQPRGTQTHAERALLPRQLEESFNPGYDIRSARGCGKLGPGRKISPIGFETWHHFGRRFGILERALLWAQGTGPEHCSSPPQLLRRADV